MGDWSRLLLVFVGIGVVLLLATALFAPWSFYLGGHFHWLPYYQAVGHMHASTGDYTVSFYLWPASGGRSSYPYFRGWGTLCTPRGERYSLRTSGYMYTHPGTNLEGEKFELTMVPRPLKSHFEYTRDLQPRLDFRGTWQNPGLVMDDQGTLSRAFNPDGTLFQGPRRTQPAAREAVKVSFKEVTGWSALFADCREK